MSHFGTWTHASTTAERTRGERERSGLKGPCCKVLARGRTQGGGGSITASDCLLIELFGDEAEDF
jgi:hypothetical protein